MVTDALLLVALLLFFVWMFYGLYLRGMIFGRYNELDGVENSLSVKFLKNSLSVEYIFSFLWFFGIEKIPNGDKKLKDLIFKQKIWLLVGLIMFALLMWGGR